MSKVIRDNQNRHISVSVDHTKGTVELAFIVSHYESLPGATSEYITMSSEVAWELSKQLSGAAVLSK